MSDIAPGANGRVRILVIDDHPVVLAGVRAFVSEVSGLELMATALTVAEAVARADILRPDVFLLIVCEPRGASLDAARLLRERVPEVPLVAMCLNDGCAHGPELRAIGATHVLEAAAGKEAFARAFDSLRVDPERAMLRRRESPPPNSPGSLSRRELEVLRLIADGHTNKQIAESLGISVRTVETHRERLMRKLSVQGTAALTKAAISLGVVDPDG